MPEIKIDKIIRSRRKSIALVVSADAELVVRAPTRMTLDDIKDLVFRKSSWINKKRNWILKNGALAKAKEFKDGEEFLYLGENYKLKIESRDNIKLDDFLYWPAKYLNDSRLKSDFKGSQKPDFSRGKIIAWYKQEAKGTITRRANFYSRLTGWKFKSISITSAKTRWGSCGTKGSINFAWKLIMAPLRVIDYVVVHELAHLVARNHSAKFWDEVRNILPDYKIRRTWLNDNRMRFKI
ncbi:MAG: hypothetical protein UW11_C0018G0033 [Parcubacteria group bacterium GW2011_GWA2_43_9b]|uniref:YgjP-like metallopeptidase domain-containing protein n=1 Tax=Candidatus Portnoybacteria bacterium RIFCSPLOWO2_02_FULL_39_11 TaxID=1802001 RepID=A0A1G2FUG5_9BACT|nr:MAG: hypothetical protein UW11_C0018G0033 [Parcubacteria group bacterium GW2011_GWA2_43_9b]OGZ41457.1 MAG: hypothetical protein A3B04_03170 [Candidatus Portnoybacteria bacterium RIFCSPLOWO2_02_FULL_39_11]